MTLKYLNLIERIPRGSAPGSNKKIVNSLFMKPKNIWVQNVQMQ